jgi:hypothetical protein
MGSPTDLPATNATSFPTTEAAALALYVDAVEAFTELMMEIGGGGQSLQSRAVEKVTFPLDFSGSISGGTASLTGSMTVSMNFLDSPPQPGNTYNERILFDMYLAGTFSKVASYGFTMSGKVLTELDMDLNMDLRFGTNVDLSDSNMDIDIALAQRYGMAISVLDTSTQVGAKFILSYALEYNQNNIPINISQAMGGDSECFFEPIIEQLEKKTVSLRVYNDADILIGDYVLSAMDIGGLDVLGEFVF